MDRLGLSGETQASAVRDRKRGALLGLAIGDALGAAIEFMAPGSFPPVIGYRAGGPHRLGPGEWTDDTSLALALAESIGRGWDLNDQAREYLLWLDTGKHSVNGVCFDIGNTTLAALRRFAATGDAWTSGDGSDGAAGNGSLMRLAPVPIAFAEWFPDRLPDLVRRLAESSLPTHASRECLACCVAAGVLMAAGIRGVPLAEALDPAWPVWGEVNGLHPLPPKVAAIVAGSYRSKAPPAIRGSGYVVNSLEAALWALAGNADFRSAVLAAVNLGDDADTTGAVCGELAGAFLGESDIPGELIAGLARRDLLEAALASVGAG